MTTLADTIEATRGHYLTTYRPQINLLDAAITDSASSLTVTDQLGGIQPGARLCIDLEHFYVRSVTGQTATVLRGMDGSTAAAHNANAHVEVNPIASNFTIYRAILDDLNDLQGNGLFGIDTYEFTYSPAVQAYDLPIPRLNGIIDISYKTPDPANTWPRVESYKLAQRQSTTDFPSGNSLVLYSPTYPGQLVHIVASVDFTPPATLNSDMASDVGLPPSAVDIPPLGAAIRLSAGREVTRNFQETQGQPRRADEVPPGANLGAARALAALRTQRINTEAANLAHMYPNFTPSYA